MDLIGHIQFLPWRQLDDCSMTRPFLSLRRVWLARLHVCMCPCMCAVCVCRLGWRCGYKYALILSSLVHMIILRGSEGGSIVTARESGNEYTRMHTAMTKGSFQAWGDMQPTDFCLVRQAPLITLHCWMSTKQ